MKNLLNDGSAEPSTINCNFHKDALLGFGLELPDAQLDSAVIQLQAAAAEQQHQNNLNNNNNSTKSNSNNNSNSGDYHQSLLNCVDLLPSAVPPPDLSDSYTFDADADAAATATELVNVANKDCDSLAKLAYNLYRLAKEDHIVIDRKRNEVVRTDAITNQKTIYRCMDPVGMGMFPANCTRSSSPFKSSRARKRNSTQAHVAGTVPKIITQPTSEQVLALNADPKTRTRSGRIIRPAIPQPAKATVAAPAATPPNSSHMLEMLVENPKDKDYRAPAEVHITSQSPAVEVQKNRTVPPNAICPGCNKIFLGRRLQSHYVKFPDHMPSAIAAQQQQAQQQQLQQHQQLQQQQQQQQQMNVPTLFGLLTAKLQRHSHLSEDQRADLFLHELTDFVEQLHLRSTRLIRNTSGLHFINARIARVLGIPEGQYALDMSAMESAQAPTPEPELQQLLHSSAVSSTRNLVDYPGLSMSLDDTLTDEAAQRLNLSAGGKLLPPSEESLLRNVSDLMQPPVAVAAPTVDHGTGAMLPHYDHASDNAVEALNMKETPNAAILDLNVDYFKFNN